MSSMRETTKIQKLMVQPITVIFRHLQSKSPVVVWLYDQTSLRIEGRIIGFDEYMNLTLDDAFEINSKKNTRKSIGKIMLKGDAIVLIEPAPQI